MIWLEGTSESMHNPPGLAVAFLQATASEQIRYIDRLPRYGLYSYDEEVQAEHSSGGICLLACFRILKQLANDLSLEQGTALRNLLCVMDMALYLGGNVIDYHFQLEKRGSVPEGPWDDVWGVFRTLSSSLGEPGGTPLCQIHPDHLLGQAGIALDADSMLHSKWRELVSILESAESLHEFGSLCWEFCVFVGSRQGLSDSLLEIIQAECPVGTGVLPELTGFCIYVFRWPALKLTLADLLEQARDLRAKAYYEDLLAIYEGRWKDDYLFQR